MKEKNPKLVTLMSLGTIMLAMIIAIGATYAYFTATIVGESKQIIVKTTTLSVEYTETNNVNIENILPGQEFTKEFTVSNSSDVTSYYDILFTNVTNTFVNKSDLTYELYKGNELIKSGNLPSTSNVKLIENVSINTGDSVSYSLKMKYLNTNNIQNSDQNKTFSTTLNINGSFEAR